MAAKSSIHTGWRLSADGTELTVEFDGSEKMAVNATGVSFLGSAAPVGVADLTGNTSTYVEALLLQIIAQLVALGFVTDSTTT